MNAKHMTTEKALALLEQVDPWADPEECHAIQDVLLVAAVRAVNADQANAKELCVIAAKAASVEGTRWFA